MILKNKLRIILGLLALLALSVIGFFVLEKSRGKKRLAQAHDAYIADGGSFDPTYNFAPSISDEENFGATPALNGITADTAAGESLRLRLEQLALDPGEKWPITNTTRRGGHEPRQKRDLNPFYEFFLKHSLLPVPKTSDHPEQDMLAAFNITHGALIEELNQASQRPFNLLLPSSTGRHRPNSLQITQKSEALFTATKIAKGLGLHACLALATGSSDTALADLRTIQKLAIAVQADGTTLMSNLIGISLDAISLAPIWEGLSDRAWSKSNLEELQAILSSRNPTREFTDAIRAELITTDELLVALKDYPMLAMDPSSPLYKLRKVLSPWVAQNRAVILEFYHQGILIPMENPDGYRRAHAEVVARVAAIEKTADFNPKTILAKLVLPATSTYIKNSARHHAELTQATTACALERYFLHNGNYPDKLTKLIPDYSASIPLDPVNGKPMPYEKTSDGRYQLHSFGMDGVDSGGAEGDITWNYSNPPESE